MMIDRKFRLPRIWSNEELKKFAHLFKGDVVNVSAWKDEDKEGKFYKDYFTCAKTYTITNYEEDAKGLQGYANELYLDLEKPLPRKLNRKFNVVFNHTTLEHIYKVQIAFKNLCKMSNDVVILVIPFLQQMHADYGDYWRFTPLTIKKMFNENGFKVLYSSFNEHQNSSIYLFFIASKKPKKWDMKIYNDFNYRTSKAWLDSGEPYVGCKAISNSIFSRLLFKLRSTVFKAVV